MKLYDVLNLLELDETNWSRIDTGDGRGVVGGVHYTLPSTFFFFYLEVSIVKG